MPPGVKLKSVDLTVSLESLSFFLAQGRCRSMSGLGGIAQAGAAAPVVSHVDARRRSRAWSTSAAKAVTAREAVARGRIRDVGRGAARSPRRAT